MKPLFTWLMVLGLTTHAQIGAYNIATAQAKRANEANNAEQQRIANATTDPTHPNLIAPAAPGDPVREATLKNIADLSADFTALNSASGDTVDAAQKAALLNSLSSAALGKKPNSSLIQKLASHLIAATNGKKNPAPLKLARNIHALFNASHLTATQQTTLLDEVKKTLMAAGATSDAADNVFDDLKNIVEEIK